MQTTLRVLKIFLASPDDVKPERAAAENLINSLNKHINATLGWHIALYRWEDAIPGYGRPQELINTAVDDCTLFIGLLWERWGQPTGKFSSGFEEEYDRALARRKKSNEPEIWLVFKAANPEKVKDPGTDLSKVLEFRRTQGAVREVLYREVADTDDWRTKLQNWLWTTVVKRAVPAVQATQPEQPVPASELEASESSAMVKEVSRQLLQTADSLTQVIKSGELEFGRQETDLFKEFDVARLYLLSSTWMSRRCTNETVGIHEMNLLYKHRQQLHPSFTEYLQIFRSMLANNTDTIPGWFWFSFIPADALRRQLLDFSTNDPSSDVRRRSITLLRTAKVKLPENLWADLPLSDDVQEVRAEAYEYLASFGDEKVLSFLERKIAAEETSFGTEIAETRLSILLRLRPNEAYSELIESGQYVSDEMVSELERLAIDIKDELLAQGAKSQWYPLRKLSVNELARRGCFPRHLAEELTRDPLASIREVAFIELAKHGQLLDFEEVRKSLSSEKESQSNRLGHLAGILGGSKTQDEPDADAVILAFYRSQNPDKVLAAVDFFRLDGVLAYKSLATDHHDAIRDTLRSDLETGFANVKQRSIDAIASRLGSEFANRVTGEFKGVEDFVRSKFIEAALLGIAKNGEPSDIRFGRQYLASNDHATKSAAVRIMCRFGTAEDVPALLQIARESWGETRDEAGAAALRFSPTPVEIAIELTKSNSSNLVRTGYNWLYRQDSAEVAKFFQASLDSEHEMNRVRSVYYFSKHRTHAELEEMLEAQFNKEAYYYNVVTWLDRLLFAPATLRESFAQDLKKQAS